MKDKTHEIILRDATIDDLKLLAYWDRQDHIMASDPNSDWNWEVELARSPAWREQLIAMVNGIAIGFVQIIDPAKEDSRYWGEAPGNLRAIDIWIGEKENLGKGYGTQMMRLALQRCFMQREITSVLIDPLETNLRAHKFYEGLGFKFLEKRIFGEDACLVFKMDRSDWERKK